MLLWIFCWSFRFREILSTARNLTWVHGLNSTASCIPRSREGWFFRGNLHFGILRVLLEKGRRFGQEELERGTDSCVMREIRRVRWGERGLDLGRQMESKERKDLLKEWIWFVLNFTFVKLLISFSQRIFQWSNFWLKISFESLCIPVKKCFPFGPEKSYSLTFLRFFLN